jgi:DNA repair protein SbcC/Rad50
MKIIEINAASFGGLKIEKPVRLSGTLDLWIAPNQSGKTTLLTFLEWMLYGPGAKRGAREGNVLRRWMPWGGGAPQGSLVVRPELKDWPGELLVTARFAENTFVLSEYNTQKTLTDRVAVAKNGECNLGDQLLNLNRESFMNSICATQGNLLSPLQMGSLRRILTSDLGALVENPDLTTVDRILSAMENPLFMINGSGQQKPLKLLKHDIVKEIDFLQLEQTKLEQQLTVFKDLLNYRESMVSQLEQQERVIISLERQIRQLEIARAYYLLKVGQVAPSAGLESLEQIEQQYPGYEKITSELEREVDNLGGQLEAIERQLASESEELEKLEERYRSEDARLKSSASLSGKIDSARQLREIVGTVESAFQDSQKANALCEQVGQRIPDKDRTRFAELEKLYTPHLEHLAAIMEWQKEEQAINARLASLRERRADLQILTRAPLPWTFYLGFFVAFLAVLMLFYFTPMMDPFRFIGYILTALLTIIAAQLISPLWKRRRTTGPAANELRLEVLPAIEQGQNELGIQDRKRRRFIELYSIDRLTWDRLVENIAEYGQLDLQMREYSSAVRDRDMISRRLNAAWMEIAAVLPLAPLSVDMHWLAQQMQELSGANIELSSVSELATKIEAQRVDVQRLRAERERYLALMQQKLEPVGLKLQAGEALRTVLGTFRQLADRMQNKRQAEDRQSIIEQSSFGLYVSEHDFEQQWAGLSETEQARLAGLAGNKQGFETVNSRLREAGAARQEAESQRERLRKTLDNLRDELAKYGRVDREAAELNQRMAKATHNQELAERWDKALKVSSSIIGSLVSSASQDAAPEVDRALKQVLSAAPIKGIKEVRIGSNLELHLTVEGASSEIAPSEIWTYLSSGAQQQLALALRLAMARTASGRTNLPLLLDEPLTDLDDERAKLVFRYIAQVAKSTQVIITTCHEQLYTWLAEGISYNKLDLPARM